MDRSVFRPLLPLSILVLLLPASLSAQDWQFVKEKNGIKVYTCKEPGSDLKSFRATTDIRSTMDRVTNLVGNVRNNDWWDENVKEIKVLYFEENKHFKYYLVYDVPWPLSDRDLCVDARVSVDQVTGTRVISALPDNGLVPEKEDKVRIKQYWQKWTIQPLPQGMIRLILEGFVDPGGNVPSWLYNMVITDTPLKVMNGVKERVEIK